MPPSDEPHNAEDVAVVRALGGTPDAIDLLRAHVTETAGERRPQQEAMAEAVAAAIRAGQPALIQAGTGTGKSIAYLAAVAAAGHRAVIATATNQLSAQLAERDGPAIARTLERTGQPVTFAVLKGRSNYACKARIADLRELDARDPDASQDRMFELPDDPRTVGSRHVRALLDWSDRTATGDRSDAPAVPDHSWAQVSVSQADCAGRSCALYDACFTEKARKRARSATIVITNHALLAQDIRTSAGVLATGIPDADTATGSMFGEHAVVVIDEAHAFPAALTAALATELDPAAIDRLARRASTAARDDLAVESAAGTAIHEASLLADALDALPDGPIAPMPDSVSTRLAATAARLHDLGTLLNSAAATAAGSKPKRATLLGTLSAASAGHARTANDARAERAGTVRWVDRGRTGAPTPILRTAPIDVGEVFAAALDTRVLIGTSATLSTGGDFTPLALALGIPHATTIDVGTPFDYATQGMLYVPGPPFPAPLGKERLEHSAAVLDEVVALVTAAGGRTLALFTTAAAARRAADRLRTALPSLTILCHGDAPADQLVRAFADDETSVLCATMGLWQGVSVEGPSCSLVIIDKVSFAPVDDVLTAARKARADELGRNGFHEVVVAQAATSLAQAAGRLIRCFDLDTEILTTDGWKRPGEIRPGMTSYGVPPRQRGIPALHENPVLAVQANRTPEPLLSIRAPWLDAAVTPDHRMLIHQPDGQLATTPAGALPDACTIPLAGLLERPALDIDPDWLWIAGYASTRAHTDPAGLLTLPADRAAPRAIADRLARTGTRATWRAADSAWALPPGGSDQLRRLLHDTPADPAHGIPGWFLTRLTGQQLRTAIDGLACGTPGLFHAPTTQDADRFQAMCALAGYRSRLTRTPSGLRVDYRDHPFAHVDRQAVAPTAPAATWCVTTTLGSVVARRNGQVFLAGNSATDRGVVAILDPRLVTKGYGRTLLATLPPFPRFNSRDTVTAALTRLTGGHQPPAGPAAQPPRTAPRRRARTPASRNATRR